MANEMPLRARHRLATTTIVAVVALAGLRLAGAASVDELMREGVALRRKGDDLGALQRFEQAYQLENSPRALAQMGLAEQALGRWVASYEHLTQALEAKADRWIGKHRATIDEAVNVVGAHVGRLEILGGSPAAELRIDGVVRGTLPLAAPLAVATGTITIDLSAPGFVPQTRTTVVRARQTTRESFDPLAAPAGRDPAATATAPVTPPAPASTEQSIVAGDLKPIGNPYADRFVALWNDIHRPGSGYFSAEGVPYHAVETLLVEAPDHGHETTSEAYSYWLWLEACYGKLTRDWSPLDRAWKNMERFIIPTLADQPTNMSYSDRRPATYAPEGDTPAVYPSKLDGAVPVGRDPLASELATSYGRGAPVYAMHWIIDVDNWYGFGQRGDGTTRPAYMNTFQRGPQESVWETIPQPSWDEFKSGGKYGYLDLFVKHGTPVRQWKYTNAPDADARAIQALFWAKTWADRDGGSSIVNELAKRAAQMGDWLRYALFDKYFKTMGCTDPKCPAGKDYDSAHYLLAWYYAWGGSVSKAGAWSFRIGASAAHAGYQNPLAAYALSALPEFKPASPNGARDWKQSLDRQLEFYRWLQSAEGGIAGGATNSWNGRYEPPPAGTPTFYGMAYDEAPVYLDPPSNEWFGFQAWSMDRVAQYFYVTGDERAKVVLDKWVGWVKQHTKLRADGGYQIPSTMDWSGKPGASWTVDSHDAGQSWNAGLHVKIRGAGDDAGVASATARALAFYAAKSGDKAAQKLAKELLDRMWNKYRDKLGVTTSETRADYKRFGDTVHVPAGWTGKMPSGDPIASGATFISLRSKYKTDPDWHKVEAYLKGGKPPVFKYHRFWTQADIAIANASYGWLFPDDTSAVEAPNAGRGHSAGSKKSKR